MAHAAADVAFPQASRSREWLIDAAIAGVLAVPSVVGVLTEDPFESYDYPEPNAWLVLLALAASLPLALRRRYPLTVLTVSLGATFVIAVLHWNASAVALCPAFALYAVAAWRRRWQAVAGLATVYVVFAVLALRQAPYFDSPLAMTSVAAFTIAWALGRGMRRWRRDRELAEARALDAEHARAVAAERAAFTERIGIAREIHDVVSHTLTVIAVQAGTARHLAAERPDLITSALTTIEQASRSALRELRRMLGVLQPADDHAASVAPSPGPTELRSLADVHSASGPVDVSVSPAVQAQPESLRLVVYRLVQEALTNARKHAPGARVTVSVTEVDDGIAVQVDNDEPPGSAGGPDGARAPGFGLAGMRERVAMFGGTLAAGPRPDGGYRVRAVLRAEPTPQLPTRPAPTAAPGAVAAEATSRGGVREGVVDTLLAVALTAVTISNAFVDDHSIAYDYPAPTVTLIALLLASGLPLALRRRWPFLVFGVATLSAATVAARGWHADWAFLCTLIALYTVAAWRPLRIALTALLCWHATLLILAVLGLAPQYATWEELLTPVGVIAFAVGATVRRWRRERQLALERAIEGERTRAAVAERAALAERLRIAGEIHDVIAHTLSAVAVQAATTRYLHESQPDKASSALAAIERDSRGALDDLRRMLGVLRTDRPATEITEPPTELAGVRS